MPSRARTLGLYLVAGLVLHAAALASGLHSDDFVTLEALRGGAFEASWARDQGGFFRPLTIASSWLEVRLHGGNALAMHVVNVLAHATCAFLVHVLAADLFGGPAGNGSTGASASRVGALAGALFLVHPSHAEAVAWISGRGDLLAAAFALLGAIAGLRYARGGSARLLAAAALAWTAAVLSKESALAVPGAFVALAAADRGRASRRRAAAVVAAGALVVALWAALRVAALGELFTRAGGKDRFDVPAGQVIGSLKRQALRSFAPALPEGDRSSIALSIVVGVVLAASLALLVRRLVVRADERPGALRLAGLIAAFALALVPVAGSRVHVVTGEGERFVYLASAFAAIGCAWTMLAALPARAARVLPIAVLLSWAVLLQEALERWRQAGRFAERVVATLSAEARGPRALILALPDSVEGAFVLRNGLDHALALRGVELDVAVLATFTANPAGGGATVLRDPALPGAWRVLLRGHEPFDPVRSPSLVRAELRDADRHTYETVALSGFSDLFTFAGGELVRVE